MYTIFAYAKPWCKPISFSNHSLWFCFFHVFTPWSDILITVILWAKGWKFSSPYMILKSLCLQKDIYIYFVACLNYSSYRSKSDETSSFIRDPGIARLSLAAVRSCWILRVPIKLPGCQRNTTASCKTAKTL